MRGLQDFGEVAEKRFEWLLNQRGYSFLREDQIERRIRLCGTRPDFYVETTHRGAFLVEVESFETAGPLHDGPSQVMVLDPEPIFERIRRAVRRAKKQLGPYRELGVPMLIVLDNWRQVGIPSNIEDLRNAVFGTGEFRQAISQGGKEVGPTRWHHGLGQMLNSNWGSYISAVAWNLPKTRDIDDPMISERPMYLRLLHNPHAGLPLPREIFDYPDDEHYT